MEVDFVMSNQQCLNPIHLFEAIYLTLEVMLILLMLQQFHVELIMLLVIGNKAHVVFHFLKVEAYLTFPVAFQAGRHPPHLPGCKAKVWINEAMPCHLCNT